MFRAEPLNPPEFHSRNKGWKVVTCYDFYDSIFSIRYAFVQNPMCLQEMGIINMHLRTLR